MKIPMSVLFGLAAAWAQAASWYVAKSGDNSDGSSWAKAFQDPQSALDAAQTGDIIYLKGETFDAYRSSPLQSQFVWTNKPLTILGGYAADGGAPGSLTSTPTVLSQPPPSGYTYTNRILYIANVTNGWMERITIRGGRLRSGEQQSWRRDVYGSGICIMDSSNLAFSAVIVDGNSITFGQQVRQWGAGVYASNSYGLFTNCVFQNNQLPRHYGNTSYGGGAHIQGGGWIFRDCVVRDNRTEYQGTYTDYGYGIGLFFNGGVHTVKNCLIARNYGASLAAPQGEGIYVAAGTVTIENCTFYWHAYEGLRRAGGAVTLRNSIVWDCGDDIAGSVALEYNNIEDGDGLGINGNISSDPLFERGLFLATNSPCVNAGTGHVETAGLAGYTTRADGTSDTGIVDMGYHWPPGYLARDFYVNAGSGSDNNDGLTPATAFKTLTRALAGIGDGSRVHVAAGTHSVSLGEIFPLTIRNRCGVQIIGSGSDVTVLDAQSAGARAITMANTYPDARVSALKMINANWATNGSNWGTPGTVGIALYLSHARGTVSDCIAMNNAAPRPGGGAGSPGYPAGTFHADISDVVFSNCAVIGNSSVSSYAEGFLAAGISIEGGRALLLNCAVTSNSTTGATLAGWGFGRGSGVYLNGTGELRNCIVCANSGASDVHPSPPIRGQGIYVAGGSWAIHNTTIVTNRNRGATADSQQLFVAGGSVSVYNSILWGPGTTNAVGTATLSYCNVGSADPAAVTNRCIFQDPLFMSPAEGDWRLQKRSPCVNAGTNMAWMASAVDLAGAPRIQSGIVDMGAYETACPGTLFVVH